MATDCHTSDVAPEIADRFVEAYTSLLGKRRADGSWGTTPEVQELVTPQVAQLLIALNCDRNAMLLQGALAWMKQDLEQMRTPQWMGYIPAFLAAGELGWLEERDLVRRFLETRPYGNIAKRQDFFWYTVPNVLALVEAGYGLEEQLIADVASDIERLDKESRKANHAGLAALFLDRTGGDAETINEMVEWIVKHKDRNTGGSVDFIHWSSSIGVSSYVLLDLALLDRLGDLGHGGTSLVDEALTFLLLRPEPDGSMPRDDTVSFDTDAHSHPLYTTTVALRAILAVLAPRSCFLHNVATTACQCVAAAKRGSREAAEELEKRGQALKQALQDLEDTREALDELQRQREAPYGLPDALRQRYVKAQSRLKKWGTAVRGLTARHRTSILVGFTVACAIALGVQAYRMKALGTVEGAVLIPLLLGGLAAWLLPLLFGSKDGDGE